MKGMKIGVDFGSSSLKIFVEGKGVVVDEPSLVAVDTETGFPIAFGQAACDIYGRCKENIEIIKVIKNGVISNFTFAERMLRYYLQRVCGNRIYKPNVLISVSADVSTLEKRTFLDAVVQSGAGRVCMVDGILASSLGCNVETDKLGGRMTVDIGHQLTELAVVSMGSIAAVGTIRRGGSEIDEAVKNYLKRERDIVIGPHTAHSIKSNITSAGIRDYETAIMVSGKSGIDNMPISFEVTSTELFPLIDKQIQSLIHEIHSVMSQIPPELLSDAADHGITLCGGGALIFDIAERFADETGIRCSVVNNPRLAKINGMGRLINSSELLNINDYHFVFKDDIKDRMGAFYKV